VRDYVFAAKRLGKTGVAFSRFFFFSADADSAAKTPHIRLWYNLKLEP
jgi:hypothetical protein